MERVVLVYISILEIFKNCTVQTSYVLISMCKIVRIHEKHCGNFLQNMLERWKDQLIIVKMRNLLM